MATPRSGTQPVYTHISDDGPVADEARGADAGWGLEAAEMVRTAATLLPQDDDFGKPGTRVREVLSDVDREHLANNVIGHLRSGVSAPILERAVAYWRLVDKGLGDSIAAGVGLA